MNTIDTVIVGGGQAGLALSACLTSAGSTHVVLERGQIGERWRSERWDSLRLLTPRWQSRLPGYSYDGPDRDGFMTRLELVEYLEQYAKSFNAPVRSGVSVTRVTQFAGQFRVETDAGDWLAKNVVVATGDCQEANVPGFATRVPASIDQVVPTQYRNPTTLAPGGVLVVGASATGLQLAIEIHASGRPVTLSVGRHTRLPRRYRGRDIMAWLDEMGLLSQRAEDTRDITASRAQPSLQLVGSPASETLDLRRAQEMGIRLVGRTSEVVHEDMIFDDNLVEDIAAADLKLASLLLRIDAYIDRTCVSASHRPAFEPTPIPETPERLSLADGAIRTVVWATGFRRNYPWLDVPVLNERGEIRHDGGVTPIPGLYALGLGFMRHRNSTFIDGQRHDAVEIAEHLMARTETRTATALVAAAS